MKCDNCPASQESNTESGYDWDCLCGYGEPPCEFADGTCGCRLHKKTIDRHIQNRLDDYAAIGDWYAAREKIIETCVICGGAFRGTDTATCDSNHNFVSEPCGQIVCYQCWEKQRHDSIYNGKVPDCCIKRGEEE